MPRQASSWSCDLTAAVELRITIRAGIHSLSGYSAHADQNDLVRFIARMGRLPAEVRLIHGDPEARHALAGRLAAETGVTVMNGGPGLGGVAGGG